MNLVRNMMRAARWRLIIERDAFQPMRGANLRECFRVPAIIERGKRRRQRTEQYREQRDGDDALVMDGMQHNGVGSKARGKRRSTVSA